MLENAEESLQDRLLLQKDEFDTKLRITKENIGDEHQKIAASLQSTREELNQILQEGLSALSKEKLSKESMAQILMGAALNIQ
ncbi:MAG TPA: hypothetical protein ENK77_01765 [Epsilonproteobacteria bacterium]|nr:hypothetical protein [Campylobacterota bacterium]